MAKKEKANIGERITSLLGNMQQKELAEKIGISNAVLSNYVNNKNDPPLSVAVKLADALGVSLDYLVNGTVLPIEKVIEAETGLSSKSARILKRINNYCKDREISNPVNLLIEKDEFTQSINEILCSTIFLLDDKQGTTDENTRKLLHQLNVSHVLNDGDLDKYQGQKLELARLHCEDAKTHMGKAIDKIRMGVWNNGTR